MNSKKLISSFLLFFILIGPGCYAEVPTAAPDVSSAPAQTAATTVVTGQWPEGWYQGAAGYEKAIQEYRATQKPVAVYINVGWCPYCRKFEKRVLSSPNVMDFMKDKIRVTINPDDGASEMAIVEQYRIRGFPSFFVHSPNSAQAMQMPTGVSPEEFISMFQETVQ